MQSESRVPVHCRKESSEKENVLLRDLRCHTSVHPDWKEKRRTWTKLNQRWFQPNRRLDLLMCYSLRVLSPTLNSLSCSRVHRNFFCGGTLGIKISLNPLFISHSDVQRAVSKHKPVSFWSICDYWSTVTTKFPTSSFISHIFKWILAGPLKTACTKSNKTITGCAVSHDKALKGYLKASCSAICINQGILLMSSTPTVGLYAIKRYKHRNKTRK